MRYLATMLILMAGHVWAQAGELYDAKVTDRTSVTDPAKLIKFAEGQWLAFSLPARDGVRSPCCWKGRWNRMGEVGCALVRKHESYGTRSDSPLTDKVIVYAQIQQGEVARMRVVGEYCPVDAAGEQVVWMGSIDNSVGLEWLDATARSPARGAAAESALHALALHGSVEAGRRLYALAVEPDNALSEEAIFWLGEVDGRMLLELAKDEQHSREVRRQALFWMANSEDENVVETLVELLTR